MSYVSNEIKRYRNLLWSSRDHLNRLEDHLRRLGVDDDRADELIDKIRTKHRLIAEGITQLEKSIPGA